MYNALQCNARLIDPLQENQTLCLSFGCIAASANARDKLRVRFISMEFLSLCIKKKKNFSKTKNYFWGKTPSFVSAFRECRRFNICR